MIPNEISQTQDFLTNQTPSLKKNLQNQTIPNNLTPTSANLLTSNIYTGTRAELTTDIRNPIQQINSFGKGSLPQSTQLEVMKKLQDMQKNINMNRMNIVNEAKMIFEGMYGGKEEMGDVDYERKVVDPYNPKIKKKSLVDMRARQKARTSIFPKQKVDTDNIINDLKKKVRVYIYRDQTGKPLYAKQEHMPKKKIF